MKGWIFGKNIKLSIFENEEGVIENIGEGRIYYNLNEKFENDIIKMSNGIFLEGYVTNKRELCQTYRIDEWDKCFAKLIEKKYLFNDLRGSFCGLVQKETEDVFFTDHVGSKALFYFKKNDIIIVSTKLYWIVKVLQDNHINYSFNEEAAKYMLTYGFMLDDSTFVKEVKRVLPGTYIVANQDKVLVEQYYKPSISKIKNITEDEAVSLIDKAFRKAIFREFEKDKEYGYKYLVDLSGGLDSRMVAWVAHEMGYSNQINFTYCRSEYLDQKISSKIAKDLKHVYYFKQLDDFQWIYDIDEILQLNNGEALYSGITGGKEFLSSLNNAMFGIEHTGMIGDVVIGCFARSREEAYAKPQFGKLQYSDFLSYNFDAEILNKYENQEIFDVYVRGFLGAMSTYSIRQEYFEVSSPFLDVDFIDACFSLPIEYRINHRIYLKWMKKYYYNSTNYGWEKWAGVKPRQELIWWRNIRFVIRKVKRMFNQFIEKEIQDNMNPIEYWYSKDKNVQKYFNDYYKNNIEVKCFEEELRKGIAELFENGTALEKAQALTVLGMAKIYFSE